jgi:hypothetical protein
MKWEADDRSREGDNKFTQTFIGNAEGKRLRRPKQR